MTSLIRTFFTKEFSPKTGHMTAKKGVFLTSNENEDEKTEYDVIDS
jgi:hypothetical protein